MEEIKKFVNDKSIVILPIGVIEEHGEHLPLATDSLQVEYIAERVAKKLGKNVFIVPSIRYGVCVSTDKFPGSISLTFDTMRALSYDILAGFIKNGFKKIILLSGHGGRAHLQALRLAAEKIAEEKDVKVLVLSDYELLYEDKGRKFLKTLEIPEWDAHGGAIETSRILALRKDLVKGKGMKSKPNLPKYLIMKGIEKKFRTGIIGDPTVASEDKGRKINDWVINEIVKLAKEL
ncbi:MAG: creatininase family protein [Candidatus Thermoplasmatota archaeon]|nr:creatininase family protein [Candidatus Thermoplasmatota archaeon]